MRFDGGGKIFCRVDDHMIRTGVARDLGLRGRRHGANDLGAAVFRHLTQEDAAAAGRGMDKAARTWPERKRRGREIVRRQSLEQHGGGVREPDSGGKGYDTIRLRRACGWHTNRRRR